MSDGAMFAVRNNGSQLMSKIQRRLTFQLIIYENDGKETALTFTLQCYYYFVSVLTLSQEVHYYNEMREY